MVKSEAPIGWRRKSSPSPVTGSNSRCMAVCRAAGERVYSTAADESVIEPPKPVMVWNVRVGSTVTARFAGGLGLNATGACPASFCWPSAVVIQACTGGDDVSPPTVARACAAAPPPAPSSRAAALAAATPPSEFLLQVFMVLLCGQPCVVSAVWSACVVSSAR